MALRTTLGQLLVNETLPESLRDYGRVFDKKGTQELLRNLAENHPEEYRVVSKKLADIGRMASTRTGGNSFGLAHMRKSKAGMETQQRLQQFITKALDDDNLDDDKRRELIIRKVGDAMSRQMDDVYKESLDENNPLALQVLSGSRGNKMNLSSLRGSDMLYSDQNENVIPMPVLRSYSQGLTPAEYWCLCASTLVRMADGTTRPIAELNSGDWVLGADKTGSTLPVQVVRRYDNGLRPCFKYSFRVGQTTRQISVVATSEHKVLAIPGERGRRHECPTKVTLGQLAHENWRACTTKPDNSDIGICETRAGLLGLLLGDGHMPESGSLVLTCADKQLILYANMEAEKNDLQFRQRSPLAFVLTTLKRTKQRRIGSRWGSGTKNPFKCWLDELGLLGRKSPDKFIPDVVSSWDNQSVAALLGGLFATDGSVKLTRRGSPIVRFCSTSLQLVTGCVRLLADRFGIQVGTISVRQPSDHKITEFGKVRLIRNWHALHYFDIAGIIAVRKLSSRISIPGIKGTVLTSSLATFKAERRTCDSFYYVSHDEVGTIPTCDIEVNHPDHLFVLANGLIVSNSGTYGARRGVLATKFATRDAGYLSKQLNQLAHRLVVVGDDEEEDENQDPDEPKLPSMLRGMPVDTDDSDNEGSLLAHDVGPYKRNTVLSPKILRHLSNLKHDRILVRSPIIGGSADGGVYGRDVGVRERGTIPGRGEQVGLTAAQALCLANGTLIRMADGSVKAIENIEPGDMVLGSSATGTLRPVRVVRRYCNGKKKCYETVFRCGTGRSSNLPSMISTLDHKILAVTVPDHSDERRPVAHVVPVCRPDNRHTRFYAKLSSCYDDTGHKYEPFAMAAGLLIGDGSFTTKLPWISFSCYDPLLAEQFNAYLASFGLWLSPQGVSGEFKVSQFVTTHFFTCDNGRVVRNAAKQWLINNGLFGKRSGVKTLPVGWRSWDNTSVSALLGGLLATDGCVHRKQHSKRITISYSSSSLVLIKEIRELMAIRFGVYSSTPCASIKKHPDGGQYDPVFAIAVNGFENVTRLANAVIIPGCKNERLRSWLSDWSVSPTSAEFGRCALVSQTYVGVRETYDIEVDHPDHLFMLDCGLIVSNSEPISQGQLSAKHSGGVAGQEKALSGFQAINQQIQIPKTIKGGAAHSEEDGKVDKIVPAPAGGHFVYINSKQHYVGQGFDVNVKPGDEVEAGDVISEGLPNHSIVVKHKGVGEGRRYFANTFRKAMNDGGMRGNRRNIELLARGLINHVKLTDEWGDYVPDDVVPYVTLEKAWKPREGFQNLATNRAGGMYLERPVLHYSVGTKVRPSVMRELERFGVKDIPVHKEPPPFESQMVRGMANLQHDPDWMTRMYGSGLKSSLLDAVHHGGVSDEAGTSFVPSITRAVNFGHTGGPIRTPEQGFKPTEGVPVDATPKPQPVIAQPIVQSPATKEKKPGGWNWAGFTKLSISRLWKTADGAPAAPKPIQPPKPTAMTPPPKAPVAPQPPAPITSVGQHIQSTSQPQTGGGQNPYAFNSGYSGWQNTFANGNGIGHLGQVNNIYDFGHSLDSEGMRILTGQNANNGRHYQGMTLPSGVGAGLPQNQQHPGSGWNPNAGMPMSQPPPRAPVAPPVPYGPAPKPYAANEVNQITGWGPGDTYFDEVRKRVAEQQGIDPSQTDPVAVQKQMFDGQRIYLALERGGYNPGGSAYNAIKDTVVASVLEQQGLPTDKLEALRELEALAKETDIKPEQRQAIDILTGMINKGPNADMVRDYVTREKLIDPSEVADYEVVQSLRDEKHKQDRTWGGAALDVALALGKPANQTSLMGLGGIAGTTAAWNLGGYKLYNAGASRLGWDLAKPMKFLKAMKLMKMIPILTPLEMAVDFTRAGMKSRDELLDRLENKTRPKPGSVGAVLNYYGENVYNLGDNVTAIGSGAIDGNNKWQAVGKGQHDNKVREAVVLTKNLQELEAKKNDGTWTIEDATMYHRYKGMLDRLRKEEASSGGVMSNIYKFLDPTTRSNSYLNKGDIGNALLRQPTDYSKYKPQVPDDMSSAVQPKVTFEGGSLLSGLANKNQEPAQEPIQVNPFAPVNKPPVLPGAFNPDSFNPQVSPDLMKRILGTPSTDPNNF